MRKSVCVSRLVLMIAGIVLWCAFAQAQDRGKAVVIGHRGACGYLPEHTLESYAFAYAQGADYVEPDCAMTQDGRFICMHDIYLEENTDVEEVFPDKKRGDGHWYVIDLTLAEVKRLRVHERLPNRFPIGKSAFEVPTLEEMIELVQGLNKTTGRDVGIYPELKHPTWHAENGHPMEAALLDLLERYGYRGKEARVFIQCFWPESLIKIRKELGSDLPLIMLIGTDERSERLVTKEGIQYVASFANGIGPAKERVEANPDLVKWAHEAGLLVHPYTIHADKVPAPYSSVEDELKRFLFDYKVDGLFIDHPDKMVRFMANRLSTR